MSYNSKGYFNITHFKEKVNVSNIISRASLIKDDVNDEVPNGTPKIIIPFDDV